MSGRGAAIVASVLVLCGVIAGLYLAGSPAEARLRRQDGRRETLLSSASNGVQQYYRKEGHLPPTLDAAGAYWSADSLGGRDPVSGLPFDYRVVNDSTYELCASFARATEGDPSVHWAHPEGRYCFAERIEQLDRVPANKP